MIKRIARMVVTTRIAGQFDAACFLLPLRLHFTQLAREQGVLLVPLHCHRFVCLIYLCVRLIHSRRLLHPSSPRSFGPVLSLVSIVLHDDMVSSLFFEHFPGEFFSVIAEVKELRMSVAREPSSASPAVTRLCWLFQAVSVSLWSAQVFGLAWFATVLTAPCVCLTWCEFCLQTVPYSLSRRC